MGNEGKKQAPPPDINDVILNMRMTAKRFESESKRAEREKKKDIDKAK